jgi:hypothetical protein
LKIVQSITLSEFITLVHKETWFFIHLDTREFKEFYGALSILI